MGIVDQFENLSNIIVQHITRTISAGRNGPSVRTFEEPAILVVTLERKSTLVHELVMPGAQQHQVVETGVATSRPMLYVMRVDKARVVTTGKRTAFVPCDQGALDGRWHGSGLATDIQWLPTLIFADNHRMTIATQSFDTFDGEV